MWVLEQARRLGMNDAEILRNYPGLTPQDLRQAFAYSAAHPAEVEELRKLGHDVRTSLEAGNANQSIPDDEVLSYATAEKRVLLTLNRKDFINLNRQTNGQHAGIVVCTQDRDYPGQARRIHEQVAAHDPMPGKLVRVNRPG